MPKDAKDVLLGKIKEAQSLKNQYMAPNINYVVAQQKKYNALVGEDERIDTLDDVLTKLREE